MQWDIQGNHGGNGRCNPSHRSMSQLHVRLPQFASHLISSRRYHSSDQYLMCHSCRGRRHFFALDCRLWGWSLWAPSSWPNSLETT